MNRTGTLYDFAKKEFGSISDPNFHEYVQELKRNNEEPVRAVTVTSDADPTEIFSENSVPGYSVNIHRRGDISEGTLTRRRESDSYDNGAKTWEANFNIIKNNEDTYTIFTVSDKDFFDKCLRNFIRALPSAISTTYLSSQELRRLIQKIDKRINGNIEVKKAVSKTTNSDTEIDYHQDEVEYYEVFNEASADNRYVDKLQLSLVNSAGEFEFFVARDCTSRFIRGEPRLYFEVFLGSLSELVSDKSELFENRSRDYGSRDTDPINIQYDEGSIQGVEENKRLIRALKGISHSSVTVFHDNPYVHASVLDFNDGTNVDVYMTSDDNISLIPGFHASRGSLARICNQINKGFLEGEVVPAKEEEDDQREFSEYISPA